LNTHKSTVAAPVALITGANSGIGRVAACELAKRGYHVFLACRAPSRAAAVQHEIAAISSGRAQVEVLPLDLADLASVRECAAAFMARGLPLQVLVANAGLAGQHGLTASGFELTFGVCHVGHFLLTQLLTPALRAGAPSRVVVVSSRAHLRAKGIDFDAVQRPTATRLGLQEYAVAKLANVLFAKELGRRLLGSGITTYALHPGAVATDVWRALPWPVAGFLKLFMLSPEQGAQTMLYCAMAPELTEHTGRYYEDCREVSSSQLADDAELARQLWERSEAWVM